MVPEARRQGSRLHDEEDLDQVKLSHHHDNAQLTLTHKFVKVSMSISWISKTRGDLCVATSSCPLCYGAT